MKVWITMLLLLALAKAAIRVKQLNSDLTVVVLEKGSEVGAHILSGAVLDPIGLDQLIPNWRNLDLPIKVPVKNDKFYILGEAGKITIPQILMPPLMSNKNNYIISLGDLSSWLLKRGRKPRCRDLSRYGQHKNHYLISKMN